MTTGSRCRRESDRPAAKPFSPDAIATDQRSVVNWRRQAHPTDELSFVQGCFCTSSLSASLSSCSAQLVTLCQQQAILLSLCWLPVAAMASRFLKSKLTQI